MDRQLNRTSLMYGVPGIILQMTASFVPALMGVDPRNAPPAATALTWVLLLAGTGLLIVGLSYYAAAKGHSRWAGLLGLLSIVGLIILAVLPDRRPQGPE